ncbi:MAG: alpha-glucosidase [Bifidobacterium sp.]|jgi:oligo-1,6-glucosidase
MSREQGRRLHDSIRTNGATPNPWWANAVVYQIYPRSFQDSNGDGFGDLKGVKERLDYLVDLGVDVIWLSPVYESPQDDNGYDISDYRSIDPRFGTLYDMDDVIAAVHERGMKIIMDLVVNHTSDEHKWFQASRHGDPHYSQWYWWRSAKPGHTPGVPGSEPNNWGSDFGGSAWQFDPVRGAYYLHSFGVKQPDLNWENPDVRNAVYDMMNWWMDRGIDGFRMDVITLISKPVREDGSLPDGEPGEDGFANAKLACADGRRLDEFLRELHDRVFGGRDGYLTVGEAPGIDPRRNMQITNPADDELDMLFVFGHMEFDAQGSKWKPRALDIVALKSIMEENQKAVDEVGWGSLFFNNHDQPRVVSRWGDTSSEGMRALSAKALALVLHMHRGTPYIYQGEELGMTNAGFTKLDQYRDVESLNLYKFRVLSEGLSTHDQVLSALAMRSRDNARTPMQWDSSRYAGFCDPRSSVPPWMEVNGNGGYINADAQRRDPHSVLAFYKELIRLRHEYPVVSAGRWELIDRNDRRVYAFVRTLDTPDADGMGRDGSLPSMPTRVVAVANLTSGTAFLPPQVAGTLGLDASSFALKSEGAGSIDVDDILISTYSGSQTLTSLLVGTLQPWEAFVYVVERERVQA